MKNHLFLSLAVAAMTVCSCGTANTSLSTPDNPDNQLNQGYGSVSKEKNSTAIKEMNVNENDIANYATMADYLRSRCPGVTVTSMPGSATSSIVIRGGNSTLSISSDPLILCDGMEIDDVNVVNPKDVYKVEVLADGSAAIYGMKAANGVLLITTKGEHDAQVAAYEQKKAERQAKKEAKKKNK